MQEIYLKMKNHIATFVPNQPKAHMMIHENNPNKFLRQFVNVDESSVLKTYRNVWKEESKE